jgi:hypothetical protein
MKTAICQLMLTPNSESRRDAHPLTIRGLCPKGLARMAIAVAIL